MELIRSVGEKITHMLVKDGKAEFIQGGYYNAVFQERRAIGLHSATMRSGE